tara:strand:- start:197 stop:772 length:576 start_codon:yes stop_codon:yes gene_type:complete
MALSKIDVANMLTGATPVANGGTGIASGTSGQFLKFTGSTTVASSAVDTGKIVQTVMDGNINFSGDVSTNSDSYQYFGNQVSITPTSSSNALIFHMHLSDVFASNKNIDINIYDKTNDTYVTGASGRQSTLYSVDDVNIPPTIMYIMENAGSGARNYQGIFKRRSGSGHVYINNGGSDGFCRFCVMEVVKG